MDVLFAATGRDCERRGVPAGGWRLGTNLQKRRLIKVCAEKLSTRKYSIAAIAADLWAYGQVPKSLHRKMAANSSADAGPRLQMGKDQMAPCDVAATDGELSMLADL